MKTGQPWKHAAMNTVFSLHFSDPQPPHPEALAGMCFQEIDRLESILSRYQPDSDITRINQLDSGESLLIDPSTHKLLLIALEMNPRTGGLFDISLGHLTGAERMPAKRDSDGSEAIFSINPNRPEVTCITKGRELDLGGIGKGFALDCAAQILADLEVDSALFSAGASTHLTFGESPWKLSLKGDMQRLEVDLAGAALSSSGTAIQGSHIVHPESGRVIEYPQQRIWTIAATGAEADAFSTACLMLDSSQIRDLLEMEESQLRVFVQSENGAISELR